MSEALSRMEKILDGTYDPSQPALSRVEELLRKGGGGGGIPEEAYEALAEEHELSEEDAQEIFKMAKEGE